MSSIQRKSVKKLLGGLKREKPMKNYGRIHVIRASGTNRGLNYSGKVVFQTYDFFQETKTLIILPDIKSENDLSDEDKENILRAVRIEDNPRIAKWTTGPLWTVKDPRFSSESYWYYDLFTKFSFREQDISIQRSIDTSKKSPKLEIIKGPNGTITKADIKEDDKGLMIVGLIMLLAMIMIILYYFSLS